MSETMPTIQSDDLFETTPPTVDELTRAYGEVAAAATGRKIRIAEELEIFKDVRERKSFVEAAYCDLMRWASVIEESDLIGADAAISTAILALQSDAITQAEAIIGLMNAEERAQPTPEEERALAVRYFYWRSARHEWQDHKESGR